MEIVSGLGDGVFWVALVVYLLDSGVGSEGFALAAIARLAPRALISAPGGILADRFDRRRLLTGLDLGRCGLMLLLTSAAHQDAPHELLLVIVLVSYTLGAPYRPALTASMPLVAGEDRLAAANAAVGTTRQLMTFIGPVVGTLLVRATSTHVAFLANAASFLIAAALVASVTGLAGRPAHGTVGLVEHRAHWRHEAAEGWREVTASPGMVVVTALVFVMYAARGAELVLFVLVAETRLGLGTDGIGILLGAVGLGALAALPLAPRIVAADRATLTTTAAVLTTGVPLALLGAIDSVALACACVFVLGAGVVMFEVTSVILLQRLARRAVLGRVFGLVGTVSNAGKLLGALSAPALVALLRLEGALVAIGAIVSAAALASIRGLTRLSRTTRERRNELRPTVDSLGTLAVFRGASASALERIAATVSAQHLHAGDVVLRQGDPADDLFVIRAGEFRVDFHGRCIDRLHTGDWCGEIGLLQRSTRTATVVAETDATVWRIPGDTFLDELEQMASGSTDLFDVMADRLARYTPHTR